MQREVEHVRRLERQHEKEPRGRIEDRGLRVRQPRLAAGAVRIPQRQVAGLDLRGREKAQRLEVVGVIAEREDLGAQQRARHDAEGERDEEGGGEAAHHSPRAQKPRTIWRVRRTPASKNHSLIRSSLPCTVSAS